MCCSTFAFAQLNKVSPLTSIVHDAAKIADVNLFINTKDFTHTFFPSKQDAYFSTVQLVHASHPFPPIWYQIGSSLSSDGKMFDFLLNPEIQKKTGHISFGYFIVPTVGPAIQSYAVFDSSNWQLIDTITDKTYAYDSLLLPVDSHEYEEDEHGRKLFLAEAITKADLRCLTGNPADSVTPTAVTYIVIIDSLNHLVSVWNPLKYFSVCEMHFEWRDASTEYGTALNWNHGNSVRWSNDGNILYSFRHVGVGKINSSSGEIMFKLGGKDTLHSISLPDSIGYSLQHDFYQRPDGKYSLFNNGDDSIRPYMSGLIYDIDEVNKKVQLIDKYTPMPQCISRAFGGFDTYNGMYFLNRGMNFCSVGNQMIDIISATDKTPVAEISGTSTNFSYRAHPTTWNISRRPSITNLNSNTLATDSISGLYGYTWYKVTDTSAIQVGTGLSFSSMASGKYIVEAKTGTGNFVSYLLSDPLNYFITGISNTKKNAVSVTYNTTDNIARITMNETSGVLFIYNINGQKINEVSLHNNLNEVYFKNSPGMYIFDITTPAGHKSCKVYVD